MLRIYISGKISGLPIEEARAKFEAAEDQLLAMFPASQIINPMKVTKYKPGKPWENYMIEDIKQLFKCNALYLLPDWRESKGAKIERCIAKQLDMQIILAP